MVKIMQQTSLILEQRHGVFSSIIYLRGFSVFIGGKKVVLNMNLKKKKKEWAKNYTFFPETTQRFFTAFCTLKIMCLNFRPEKQSRKETHTIWSKGLPFLTQSLSRDVNYRVSVSGPFQYMAPIRAPE